MFELKIFLLCSCIFFLHSDNNENNLNIIKNNILKVFIEIVLSNINCTIISLKVDKFIKY